MRPFECAELLHGVAAYFSGNSRRDDSISAMHNLGCMPANYIRRINRGNVLNRVRLQESTHHRDAPSGLRSSLLAQGSSTHTLCVLQVNCATTNPRRAAVDCQKNAAQAHA